MGRHKKRSPYVKAPSAPVKASVAPQPAPVMVGLTPAMDARLSRLERALSAKLDGVRSVAGIANPLSVRLARVLMLPYRIAADLLWLARSRRRAKYLKDWRTIRHSGLFDQAYYLWRYPDVAVSGANPMLHYCRIGWREGRDPSPTFVTKDYLAKNPDVVAKKVNPLCHYIRQRKNGAVQPPDGSPKKFSPQKLTRVPNPPSPRTLDGAFIEEIRRGVREGLYGKN